jgi:hypothetical protein
VRSSQAPGTSSVMGRPRATGGARPADEILTDVTVDRGGIRAEGKACVEDNACTKRVAKTDAAPGAPARTMPARAHYLSDDHNVVLRKMPLQRCNLRTGACLLT